MKIAATTAKGGLDDVVFPVFGRAPSITVVTVLGGKVGGVDVYGNPYMNAVSGAGIQLAQFVINKNIGVVFSGNIGPRAASLLYQAGIEIVQVAGIKVQDAVEKYLAGKLKSASNTGGAVGMPPLTRRPMSGGGQGYGRRRGYGYGRGRQARSPIISESVICEVKRMLNKV